MVYLMKFPGADSSCTTALFGVQYRTLTPEKLETIAKLLKLIKASAGHVDCVWDEQDSGSSVSCSTVIVVAYWLSSAAYRSWWKRDDVQTFWAALPDDAGVWREVVTVPDGRFMHASSRDRKTGLALLAELEHSGNEAYWGVYRNRLADSKKDDFSSPYRTAATPKRNGDSVEKPVLSVSNPTGEAKPIRPGRVHVPRGIDNMIFVREYQNYSGMPEVEQEIHANELTPHVTAWMKWLDKERSKSGILSFRTSVGIEGAAEIESATAAPLSSPRTTGEKDQFAYFLDLAHFERAGKSFGDHCKLRSNTLKQYGPGGDLEKAGNLHLMVEVNVLKVGDLEAEYVGCVQGTGLMGLEAVVGGDTTAGSEDAVTEKDGKDGQASAGEAVAARL